MALNKNITKNAEFTYGLHAGFLSNYVPDNMASIYGVENTKRLLEKFDAGVMGSVRALNHEHELLRQAIAYTLPHKIDHAGNVLFLVYQRNKKNIGEHGEEQISHKFSLAPGGHVERDDLQYYEGLKEDRIVETPVIDFSATLEENHDRELREEVAFYKPVGENEARRRLYHSMTGNGVPIGFVMDSKKERGYVGNIHFGIVHGIRVPSDIVEFEMVEINNDAVGWFSPEQLATHILTPSKSDLSKEGIEFEPWSRMLIEKIDKVVFELRSVAASTSNAPA